jgi:hypothetical protein
MGLEEVAAMLPEPLAQLGEQSLGLGDAGVHGRFVEMIKSGSDSN